MLQNRKLICSDQITYLQTYEEPEPETEFVFDWYQVIPTNFYATLKKTRECIPNLFTRKKNFDKIVCRQFKVGKNVGLLSPLNKQINKSPNLYIWDRMAFYSFFPLDYFGPNFSLELDN